MCVCVYRESARRGARSTGPSTPTGAGRGRPSRGRTSSKVGSEVRSEPTCARANRVHYRTFATEELCARRSAKHISPMPPPSSTKPPLTVAIRNRSARYTTHRPRARPSAPLPCVPTTSLPSLRVAERRASRLAHGLGVDHRITHARCLSRPVPHGSCRTQLLARLPHLAAEARTSRLSLRHLCRRRRAGVSARLSRRALVL